MEGPANHAFASPFVIVVGTAGTPRETSANGKTAKALAAQYKNAYNADVFLIADSECTDTHLQTRNLVVVGSEESNRVLSLCVEKMGDRWPYTASRDKIAVRGTGRTFSPHNSALYAIYPSPWNAQKYVLVVSGFNGALPDLGFGWRAGFWLPDYAIFSKGLFRRRDRRGEGIRMAGHFNEDWQIVK